MLDMLSGFFSPLYTMPFGDLVVAILKILLIDLVLSGDNAAVIGLAVRHLPKQQRRRAAVLGAGGAIILRAIFTIFATLLINLKFVSLAGGLILLFITWKLLKDQGKEHTIKEKTTIWAAVGIIIVADISMAFDNVLAVAGAAHGAPVLVIIGLLFSIPLLVWGSTLLSDLMVRYPVILYIGGGVLLHTAIMMILDDKGHTLGETLGIWGDIIAWGCAVALLAWGILKTVRERRNAQASATANKGK